MVRPTPPTARLLAAGLLAAAAVALECLTGGAGATVVTTCRAAADSDARVDYGFCVAELGNHRESPDADTWGLAKVAALTGVNNCSPGPARRASRRARRWSGERSCTTPWGSRSRRRRTRSTTAATPPGRGRRRRRRPSRTSATTPSPRPAPCPRRWRSTALTP
ncbi:hypothetical protein C2845_PMPSC021345 [Panicum miliaceum]|uniref:Pectinesterase inhibitor domain-containing protein n=1 Tax=Panicum miliaceum TaxID=4540 RepID=A0A3L6PBW5_PANMI|nr:hypothetical protein C2845_PMPSC021345 [Panicum miliaceum]